MVEVPKVLISPCKAILPTEIKLCCKVLGTPTSKKSLSAALENFLGLRSVFTFLSCHASTPNAVTELTP